MRVSQMTHGRSPTAAAAEEQLSGRARPRARCVHGRRCAAALRRHCSDNRWWRQSLCSHSPCPESSCGASPSAAAPCVSLRASPATIRLVGWLDCASSSSCALSVAARSHSSSRPPLLSSLVALLLVSSAVHSCPICLRLGCGSAARLAALGWAEPRQRRRRSPSGASRPTEP